MKRTVLLIGGPGGSGKTTLAKVIEARYGYARLSEDDLWAELKKNSPVKDWRTPEEEAVIAAQAIDWVRERVAEERDVVLEFILYADPPAPLLRYRQALREMQVTCRIAILRPDRCVIIRRKRERGRENERTLTDADAVADSQIAVLKSAHIAPEWIVDNSDLTAEQTAERIMNKT